MFLFVRYIIYGKLQGCRSSSPISGADPGFQVRGGGGAHLKKNGAERREARNIWAISCEKSRSYAKKSYFFQF